MYLAEPNDIYNRINQTTAKQYASSKATLLAQRHRAPPCRLLIDTRSTLCFLICNIKPNWITTELLAQIPCEYQSLIVLQYTVIYVCIYVIHIHTHIYFFAR